MKAAMTFDRKKLFVVIDGIKIAKRGRPGTRQAMTWVSLKPGWRVLDEKDGKAIVIEHDDVNLQ